MASGGSRHGAGRKKGSRSQKTRAVAERVAKEGLTPLDVMIKAMRFHYDAEEWDEAAAVAKDAAPYMHPRLSAVEASLTVSVSLAAALDALRPRNAT